MSSGFAAGAKGLSATAPERPACTPARPVSATSAMFSCARATFLGTDGGVPPSSGRRRPGGVPPSSDPPLWGVLGRPVTAPPVPQQCSQSAKSNNRQPSMRRPRSPGLDAPASIRRARTPGRRGTVNSRRSGRQPGSPPARHLFLWPVRRSRNSTTGVVELRAGMADARPVRTGHERPAIPVDPTLPKPQRRSRVCRPITVAIPTVTPAVQPPSRPANSPALVPQIRTSSVRVSNSGPGDAGLSGILVARRRGFTSRFIAVVFLQSLASEVDLHRTRRVNLSYAGETHLLHEGRTRM